LQRGDVGYIPQCYSHSIEKVGSGPARSLIGFNDGIYETIDLSQWIAANLRDVLATNFGQLAISVSRRKCLENFWIATCSSPVRMEPDRRGPRGAH
jgi:oxalate decarboxylase/phosphoglucose isomerase-like protein (cupin superfamily)